MQKIYTNEHEAQIDFFENYNIDYKKEDVLTNNTDGLWNGNLLEFKLYIKDINETLFQSIKYLSQMRVKGVSIPANILLISLNERICYQFKSQDYFDDIHKIYVGAASKNNSGFVRKDYSLKLDYSTMEGSSKLKSILKEKKHMKIDIDENCIVGWAQRFYRENPTAKKGDFLGDSVGQAIKQIGEIREPKVFKDYINPYPYETNAKFKYLMDVLSDKLIQKQAGAYYTPKEYCEKAAELLRKAIANVPPGKDYVIIDRCAGTGNLESVLTDEELKHVIVSTYEYYEYKVLNQLIGHKVLDIIPPTEAQVEFSNGFIKNADALSKEFLEIPNIKKYIDDKDNYTIILYENVPFSEASTVTTNQNKSNVNSKAVWKQSYLVGESKDEIKGTARNELANFFIWSAFKYYLREPGDSYIVFSPMKYWKYNRLADKNFIDGFAFNRKHFHANCQTAIGCILWENTPSKLDEISLKVYDIDKPSKQNNFKSSIKDLGVTVSVKKIQKPISEGYDTRVFEDDYESIVVETNGYETQRKKRGRLINNTNMIGYMVAQGCSFEQPRLMTNLTRLPIYNGNGFHLRRDNYISKLPLFTAGKYPIEHKWYENGILGRTLDDGFIFENDNEFLKQCFIFTNLSYFNKCISFKGSDGVLYKNELCFDSNTIASRDLMEFNLNSTEQELISLWNRVLSEAKKNPNYNSNYTYGVYQISLELDLTETQIIGTKKKKIYLYPELHSDLQSLKFKLKEYYSEYIIPSLFKYGLIK